MYPEVGHALAVVSYLFHRVSLIQERNALQDMSQRWSEPDLQLFEGLQLVTFLSNPYIVCLCCMNVMPVSSQLCNLYEEWWIANSKIQNYLWNETLSLCKQKIFRSADADAVCFKLLFSMFLIHFWHVYSIVRSDLLSCSSQPVSKPCDNAFLREIEQPLLHN